MVKVRYIDHGIGFTVIEGDELYIELNKDLKKYPNLHKKVLNHELEHIKKGKTKIDFIHDLKSMFDLKLQWDLFKFSLKHPSTKTATKVFLKIKGGYTIIWFNLIMKILFWVLAIFIGIILFLILK